MALDSTAEKSQGTYMEIGGGLAGTQTVTIIALGSPTILTIVGHTIVNGDLLTMAAFGGADAADINGQVLVASNVTTDTFAVNFNSTGLDITDDTDSATVNPGTWTEVGSVIDMNKNDPGSNEIDTTHLRSEAKEFIFGLVDSGEYTMTINWSFDDTAQVALRLAQTNSTTVSARVTYADAETATFIAYVSTFNGPGAAVDGILTGDLSMKITGPVVYA
jgi:hypothetical protein